MIKVYAALRDDVSEGHVWLEKPGLPARCVVTITNTQNGRTVYCESFQFEKNFLSEYNQSPRIKIDSPASSIVMSYWYRAHLGGLETHKVYPLDVEGCETDLGQPESLHAAPAGSGPCRRVARLGECGARTPRSHSCGMDPVWENVLER